MKKNTFLKTVLAIMLVAAAAATALLLREAFMIFC